MRVNVPSGHETTLCQGPQGRVGLSIAAVRGETAGRGVRLPKDLHLPRGKALGDESASATRPKGASMPHRKSSVTSSGSPPMKSFSSTPPPCGRKSCWPPLPWPGGGGSAGAGVKKVLGGSWRSKRLGGGGAGGARTLFARSASFT